MQWPSGAWIAVLMGAGALAAGVYLMGLRANRRIALRVAGELERALKPVDTSYTWIGGLIGFHAGFHVPGFSRVKITCTMLPRHSIAFLPVSLLLGRGDRLHVTFYLPGGFEDESHLVSRRALLSPLLHIRGCERMRQIHRRVDGRWFVLLSTSEPGLERMSAILDRLHEVVGAGRLRHLAAVPDLHTLHVQLVPASGVAERTLEALLADPQAVTGGSVGAGSQESGEEMGGMQNVPDTPGTLVQE